MAGIEDILVWKDVGIGIVGMYVFYMFATTVTNNAAKQMLQLHTDFLLAYRENTKALVELIAEFKEHMRLKDDAIRLLENKYRKEQ